MGATPVAIGRQLLAIGDLIVFITTDSSTRGLGSRAQALFFFEAPQYVVGSAENGAFYIS